MGSRVVGVGREEREEEGETYVAGLEVEKGEEGEERESQRGRE